MENLIGLVNELDEIFSRYNSQLVKDLPHIVVVGGQSAGKSSVLESFVGRDFLPRGSGIVTRRPLILKLKNNKDDEFTYAKFANDDDIYEDFDEIRDKIEEYNKSAAEEEFGVSQDPVHLEIFSPSYLDLTLVDLPGMVRVSGKDQSDKIGEAIKAMIISFIEKENCLILAVTPANNDLANSDAIELSRQVDPEGERTIGVLTKLDLMDKGTDARLILVGKHAIELKKGFIGVVNRSQKDIDDRTDMSSALDNEIKFFKEHYAYKDIAHRQGVNYLKKYLHDELRAHIKKELPIFRKSLREELKDIKKRLDSLRSLDDITKTVGSLVSFTLNKLKKLYKSEVGDEGAKVVFHGQTIGVEINGLMNEEYCRELDDIGYDEDEIIELMTTAVKNINGTKKQMFSSNKAFFEVVRILIGNFREPTLNCVEEVTIQLKSVIKKCTKAIEYPRLSEIYQNILNDILEEMNEKCREVANGIINIHQACFNSTQEDILKAYKDIFENKAVEIPITFHNQYGHTLNGSGNSIIEIRPMNKQDTNAKDGQMTIIKDLIIDYVNSIKRDMKSILPKIIHLHLVDAIGMFIDNELHNSVCEKTCKSSVESLISGCLLMDERNELKEKKKCLDDVLSTIEKHLEHD